MGGSRTSYQAWRNGDLMSCTPLQIPCGDIMELIQGRWDALRSLLNGPYIENDETGGGKKWLRWLVPHVRLWQSVSFLLPHQVTRQKYSDLKSVAPTSQSLSSAQQVPQGGCSFSREDWEMPPSQCNIQRAIIYSIILFLNSVAK